MDQLLAMARSQPDSPEFRAALVKHLGEALVKTGEAYNSNGPDFVWAVEAASQPTIVIDDQPAGALRRVAGSNLWFHVGQLKVGTGHRFHYLVDGKPFGGSVDVPAYAHHAAHAASELPCLTWLWRDYDPAKTEQVFEQSGEERARPPFRVRIYNR